jgi:hypothetical protein
LIGIRSTMSRESSHVKPKKLPTAEHVRRGPFDERPDAALPRPT